MTSAPPASLLARAFDTGPDEAPADASSERILDAALELAAASGIENLTMDNVARRARVGRMTVYRRFGDREGLVGALTGREVRSCLAELDAAADPELPVADQVAEGFVASLRLVRTHPMLQRLARFQPEAALAVLNDSDGAVFALCREFVAARIGEAQARGDVAAKADPRHLAELLVRLGLTFALIPNSSLPLDEQGAIRKLARELIAPLVA